MMQSKANNWRQFGSRGWILIPNETPDKTPPGFHLRSNRFFIWDQTGFSSEIKHLHFLWARYLLQYQRRNMSLHNFLKFQSRRHVKNSVFGTRGEALVIILDIFLENSEQWKIHFQPELSLQTYSIKRTRYQRFRLSETQTTINKPLYWKEVLCTANDIPV